MRVKEALNRIVSILKSAELPEPREDAILLLAKVLDTSTSRLPILWGDKLSGERFQKLTELAKRRLKREPVQFILGSWEFLDLDLIVSPAALIPRPETEEWVSKLISLIDSAFTQPQFYFADIGTGTGAIGLAVGKHFPEARGWLCDISESALALAGENLRRYPEMQSRINLLRQSGLSAFADNSLDLIVTNPPYISSIEIPDLMPEVRDYEPKIALDGGESGLEIIEPIIKQACYVLKENGILALEHGYLQRRAIFEISLPGLNLIEAGKDFAGLDRYIFWRKELFRSVTMDCRQ